MQWIKSRKSKFSNSMFAFVDKIAETAQSYRYSYFKMHSTTGDEGRHLSSCQCWNLINGWRRFHKSKRHVKWKLNLNSFIISRSILVLTKDLVLKILWNIIIKVVTNPPHICRQQATQILPLFLTSAFRLPTQKKKVNENIKF